MIISFKISIYYLDIWSVMFIKRIANEIFTKFWIFFEATVNFFRVKIALNSEFYFEGNLNWRGIVKLFSNIQTCLQNAFNIFSAHS